MIPTWKRGEEEEANAADNADGEDVDGGSKSGIVSDADRRAPPRVAEAEEGDGPVRAHEHILAEVVQEGAGGGACAVPSSPTAAPSGYAQPRREAALLDSARAYDLYCYRQGAP